MADAVKGQRAFPFGDGPMAGKVRAFDWASTPLGAISTWPAGMRIAVNTALSSQLPICLFLGPELIAIYNDAYVPLLGQKANSLGEPFQMTWAEVWDSLGPVAERALGGQSAFFEDHPIDLDRFGGIETGYFTFSYSPVFDENDHIIGIIDSVVETTGKVLSSTRLRQSEQRLRFLAELDEDTRQLQAAREVMAVSTRLLGQYLKVSRCAYADMESDDDHFTIRADYCVPGIASTVGFYSLDLFGAKAVGDLKAGRTLVLRDIAGELAPQDGGEMFASIGINAIVTCPLIKEGRLRAMMAVHDTGARDWTEAEIRMIEAVVQRCWAHIERIASEDEVRNSRQALQHLIDVIPLQVWTARADGQLDYVNAFTQDYVGGITIVDGIVDWTDVIHPDDLSASLTVWGECLGTGSDYEVQQRIRHHSGAYRWNLTRARALREPGGTVVRWYGTNTDIEEQRVALEQMEEARNSAEAANMAKSEFLANMSHEIRTPMNAVIGLSTIMAKSAPLTPKQREYIRTLQMSADSLLSLINDLLDIAKIEARTVELEHIAFSLPRLIQEVASMLAVPVKQKGLQFTADGDCSDTRMFYGDPTRLRQIIVNLCSNAIKFTSEGGVHLSITCDCHDTPTFETICIKVTDSGIGIAPDKIDSIFDKFIQADSSINRRYGGTGLGLAITKTLAEIMGGTIAVESVVGTGSTFTVCIPLEIAPDHVEATGHGVTQMVDAVIEQKTRPIVLLVEDFAPNVLVASTFLEDFGYRVEVAGNGLEAFEKAKSGLYKAALMDVQMPGLNGLDATKMIRAYERQMGAPHLRIIGMTAHAMAGDRERCLSVGMDDYIAKPFNPAELQAKLKM